MYIDLILSPTLTFILLPLKYLAFDWILSGVLFTMKCTVSLCCRWIINSSISHLSVSHGARELSIVTGLAKLFMMLSISRNVKIDMIFII